MNKDFIKQEIKKAEETLSALRKKLEEPEPPQKDIEGAKKWLVDFLNENFQSGKATVKIDNERTIYYLNGQWVFVKNRKSKIFWVYYFACWEIFYDKFNLKYKDVEELMKELVLKPFDCEGYTPNWTMDTTAMKVLKPFDCEGYTPFTTEEAGQYLALNPFDYKTNS